MITVIIPHYNYRQYLAKRINSILSQTRKDLEIIFLDDASTDNSLPLAEKLLSRGHIPYRIITNPTNSGSVFHQWQLGLDKAQGDFIWFAEADDLSHPRFLEEVMKPLETHKSVVLSYCDSQVIDSKNRLIWPDFYKKIHREVNCDKWESPYINKGLDEIERALFIKNTIPNASGVVMRKNTLLEVGGIPQNWKGSGDWQTYINLLQKGDIAYSPELLNYNRIHNQRVTSQSNTWENYFMESLNIAKANMKQFSLPPESIQKYLRNWMNQAFLTHFELDENHLSELSFFPEDLAKEEYTHYKELVTRPVPSWFKRQLKRFGALNWSKIKYRIWKKRI